LEGRVIYILPNILNAWVVKAMANVKSELIIYDAGVNDSYEYEASTVSMSPSPEAINVLVIGIGSIEV
jgi:hypothetical protein